MLKSRLTHVLIALGLIAAGCAENPVDSNRNSITAPPLASVASDDDSEHDDYDGAAGMVFLMSNQTGGNEILSFSRDEDGVLTASGAIATGGLGTGGGLGNQSSLILNEDRSRLYAVNAGSNDISVFRVNHGSLELLGSPVNSMGERPISLTIHEDLLYVLNAGGSGNIAGFRVKDDGTLMPIPGSIRPLGSDATGPAQVGFNPNGRTLVVTEKATNTVSSYSVGADGTAQGPVTIPSIGQTPFGFAFNPAGFLVISEAAGGAPGVSSASSYRVGRNGPLHLISGAVPTTQTAACWIAISENGKYAFTTNAGSGTLSSLRIGHNGKLTLANPVAGDAGPGSTPLDAAFSAGGRYLYVRLGMGTVGAFRFHEDGDLELIGKFGSLPAGANGLAAI